MAHGPNSGLSLWGCVRPCSTMKHETTYLTNCIYVGTCSFEQTLKHNGSRRRPDNARVLAAALTRCPEKQIAFLQHPCNQQLQPLNLDGSVCTQWKHRRGNIIASHLRSNVNLIEDRRHRNSVPQKETPHSAPDRLLLHGWQWQQPVM